MCVCVGDASSFDDSMEIKYILNVDYLLVVYFMQRKVNPYNKWNKKNPLRIRAGVEAFERRKKKPYTIFY